MPVIDVHTHMISQPWLDLLHQHGGPKYSIGETAAGQETIFMNGAPFMTLFPEMLDFDKRIENMDKAKVDMAVVSLTCPSAYWGGEDISDQAALTMNNVMAEQQDRYPDRLRWFATLPWQYADRSKKELARAIEMGAAGVFVTANIDLKNLTAEEFAPIWQAIDDAGLPVLVHPTAPQGSEQMGMDEYGLVPPVGFMFDTTLAISRMIFDGFIDRYPNLSIIAAHGGATLPYLAGRLDRCHEMIPACSEKISDKPSEYLKRLYYDSVVYEKEALDLCIHVAGGPERVMYGSDYPHNIGDMSGCLARVNSLGGNAAAIIKGTTAEKLFGI
ncbi:amidohydrolase family protein [Parasphingorhabdus cellanae]|uniref:Amidohydrolase n=1 Tax=Parasphingorhabdus cellanae TaxID=2806553 RepID=A0ABX7T6J0_9SPHN|nr:amidohydrolase family protein [Parasphingorhabdus cellanae]QTD55830.1 amidohydrolase [Parasphingorhabdus cellanae]